MGAKIAMREATAEDRTQVPASVALIHSAPPPSNMPEIPGLGTLESVRQEIEDAYDDAKSFYQREPDEVIRLVSGHCARLSELRTRVGRVDANPYWRRVKTELEECLEELRSQFNYHSRIIASRELDWKIETGGRQT